MKCIDFFTKNISIVVYIVSIYLFSFLIIINDIPSHIYSDALIPGPTFFPEFDFYGKHAHEVYKKIDVDTSFSSRWMNIAPYKRVVLLLLDAHRLDYVLHDPKLSRDEARWVYTNKMPKFSDKLQNLGNKARLFRFKADFPTTTVARIKSIISGHPQAYLEITDNNNPVALKCDSILNQLYRQNRNVVIMGDSLWDSFQEEVPYRHFTRPGLNNYDNSADIEVFQHFFNELMEDDWNLLIGHLIGVDHFGHAHGIEQPKISEMLNEYDEFVSLAVDTILTKKFEDTLFLVFSDHGTNPDGSHGGRNPEEVDSFLAAFSYKGFDEPDYSLLPILSCKELKFLEGYRLKHSVLNGESDNHLFHWASHNDLAPTLALMMGFPIPFNSTGRILYELAPPYFQHEDKKFEQIYKQRYYSQMCHINLHSLLRNYYQKLSTIEKVNQNTYSFKQHAIIKASLFRLTKLYYFLIIFNDFPTFSKKSSIYTKLLNNHLSLCQNTTTVLIETINHHEEIFNTKPIFSLLLFLTICLYELVEFKVLCKYFPKILISSLLLSFLVHLINLNGYFTQNYYLYFVLSLTLSFSLFIFYRYFFLNFCKFVKRIDYRTFSSTVGLFNNFFIPEFVITTFHFLTPFLESLAILANRCCLSFNVYLMTYNLLAFEDWNHRIRVYSEFKEHSIPILHLIKSSGFLLKSLAVGILLNVLPWIIQYKSFTSLRFWSDTFGFHPVPILTFTLLYSYIKWRNMDLDYDFRTEFVVWFLQSIITSRFLVYSEGEWTWTCYLFAKISFITAAVMLLFELFRPLKSKKPGKSSTFFKFFTIAVHLLWPGYLLFGQAQALGVMVCFSSQVVYFEFSKPASKTSEVDIASSIRIAIVYIFLGEHFYYSTGLMNSFFTMPFNSAYILTGTYTRVLSESLIAYQIYFFPLLSSLWFTTTVTEGGKAKEDVSNLACKLSFGVYYYTLLSALVLIFMVSHRLFFIVFLPSTVFIVSRISFFFVITRLLFIVYQLHEIPANIIL